MSNIPHHLPTETEAKGTPDTLDFAEVQRRLDSPLAGFVRPSHAQTLCLWGEESSYSHVELEYGGAVRLKTKGNSPFIGKYILIVKPLISRLLGIRGCPRLRFVRISEIQRRL